MSDGVLIVSKISRAVVLTAPHGIIPPLVAMYVNSHVNHSDVLIQMLYRLNGREHLREKHLGATSVQLSDSTKQSRSRVKSGIHVISQQSESKLTYPDDQSIEVGSLELLSPSTSIAR